MKADNIYNAAIYLRLSKDDGDLGSGKSESNSISSQRDMIRSFIRKQEDIEIYDIYVDDGYSGANFDRPEFKRMMNDVEFGEVNCIVVKDLSRFGRDYIEAGRLIQKTFPALNVRFIAISDNYDSMTADDNETSLVLPIKNFVNDSYCRDISQKVKSHLKVKREKGEYIGAFVVYGYRKDKRNKNHLVPDAYAAEIVRDIFNWRISGMTLSGIAKKLNQRGILSPMEYKKLNGDKVSTSFAKYAKAEWSANAVKRILANELYTGTMVQGKGEVINHKLKQIAAKPPEEWVRVEDTHEAIISKEIFDNAARMALVECRAGGGLETAHIFTGLLFCGDCNTPMAKRMNKYKGSERIYYICQTRNKGLGCTRHSVTLAELETVVLKSIQTQIALFLDKAAVLQQVNSVEMGFEDITKFDLELTKLRDEQEKYLGLRSGLYEDLKKGILSEEDFHSFKEIYESRYKEIQETIERQEQVIKDLFRSGIAAGVKLERFKEVLTFTECSRDMLMTFIDKVYVYEDKRINIVLKHKEQFRKVVMLAEYVEASEMLGGKSPSPGDGGVCKREVV